MDDDPFKKLRQSNGAAKPDYSFRGTEYPPRQQPPPQPPLQPRLAQPAAPRYAPPQPTNAYRPFGQTQQPPPPRRTDDFDRPHAYQPPARHAEEGAILDYEPPGFKEILKDLGLRALEVCIAAGAQAVGEEIAYFFRKRRFYTDQQKARRDW